MRGELADRGTGKDRYLYKYQNDCAHSKKEEPKLEYEARSYNDFV